MSAKVLIPASGGLRRNSEEVSSHNKAKVNRYLDSDDDNHTTVTTSSATTVRASNRTKLSIPQFRNRTFTPDGKADTMAQPYRTIKDFLIENSRQFAQVLLDDEAYLVHSIRRFVQNAPLRDREIVEQYGEAFNHLYNNGPPPFQTIERFLSARSQQEAQALLGNQTILTQVVRTLVVAENPPLGDNAILVEYLRAMQRLHSNAPPIQNFQTIFDFVQGRTRINAEALLQDESYLVSHIRRVVVTAPIERDEILLEYRHAMIDPLPIQPSVTPPSSIGSRSFSAFNGSELAALSSVEAAPEPGRAADPVAAARDTKIAGQDTASASVGNLPLFVNRNNLPNNPDDLARTKSNDSSDVTTDSASWFAGLSSTGSAHVASTLAGNSDSMLSKHVPNNPDDTVRSGSDDVGDSGPCAGLSNAWSKRAASALAGNMDNYPDGVATANSDDSSDANDGKPPAKKPKL